MFTMESCYFPDDNCFKGLKAYVWEIVGKQGNLRCFMAYVFRIWVFQKYFFFDLHVPTGKQIGNIMPTDSSWCCTCLIMYVVKPFDT